VNPTTRRAALGALVTAFLLSTACGTRVESAAILAAEGHSAAAPAGDGGGFGGTITTAETAGADRAAISSDPVASAAAAGPVTAAASGTAGSTAAGSRNGAAAPAASPAPAGKGTTAGATSAGGAGSGAGSGTAETARTPAATTKAATPGAPTAKGCSQPGSPLVIGQVGGFSGIVSNVLLPARIGMQVWVSDINARGGIACHPVKLFQVDDGSDSSRSAAAVRDLVENKKVVALVGSSVPISIVGYRSASEQLKIPSVGGDSLNYDWSQSPVLFPQGATFSATIIGAVKQLADQGKTKLASSTASRPATARTPTR